MNKNEKRKELIRLAMAKKCINKKQLSKALNLSYPTMLSKLENTGSFKWDEVDSLCRILNVNLT